MAAEGVAHEESVELLPDPVALLKRLEEEGKVEKAREEYEYRDYESAPPRVREHYTAMRSKHTLENSRALAARFGSFDLSLTIFEAFEALDQLVDASDPDLDLPNSVHALQTALAMRDAGLPDWFVCTGFIHDLGKVLFLKEGAGDEVGVGKREQWALVGDTFVLGVPPPASAVLPELNELSPYKDAPELGEYEAGCGLDALVLSYGHDEYMYQVLCHNKHNLPEEALHVIRYHSCYPHHTHNAYEALLSPKDKAMLPWLKLFQRFDLYSKDDKVASIEEEREYLQGLVDKYLNGGKWMW